MKNQYFNTTLNILIALILFFTHCKKDTPTNDIILYDKTTIVTQSYIQGKWRVHYYYGGICGSCKQDMEMYNDYFEFKKNNGVVFTFQNMATADTAYQFTEYQQNSSDYIHNVIKFYTRSGSPYSLEVNKIKNDTLILAVPFINSPDYFSIFLTKTQ